MVGVIDGVAVVVGAFESGMQEPYSKRRILRL